MYLPLHSQKSLQKQLRHNKRLFLKTMQHNNLKKTFLSMITKVIFNDPATIVFWSDNTKTVVKAQDEPFDPEKGFLLVKGAVPGYTNGLVFVREAIKR